MELESLLVKLVGDGSHYIKTLQEAEAKSKEHAKELHEQAEKSKEHLKMIAEGIEGITSKWNALKAAVAGFIGFEVIKTGFEWIEKGVEDVANLAKQAQRFGVSVEKLSTIQFAAGKEAHVWESALRHLNMQLGQSALAGEKTRDVFSKLGLSGAALSQMGNDAAIDVLADKFKQMGGSAESSALAQRLFGREAAMLLPILRKGSEGFKEAAEAAKKMGYSVDAIGAGKALAAEESLDHMAKAFEGLQRTAAIEFAPVISGIADQVTEIISQAGGGKELFKSLAEGTKNFVVTLVTGIQTVSIQVMNMAQQVKALIDYWSPQNKTEGDKAKAAASSREEKGWQNQEEADSFFMEMLHPGWGINKTRTDKGAWGSQAKQFFDPIIAGLKEGGDKAIKELTDTLDRLGKAKPPVDKQEALIKTADEYINKLNDETDALEQGIKGVVASKLAHDGLNASKLQEIEIAQKQLDLMKKTDDSRKKDEDEIKKITEGREGTIDKLRDKMKDLNRYFEGGHITKPQYAMALADEFSKLDKDKPEPKHPEAAQAGSKQAYDAILRAEDKGKKDVQTQIRDKIEMIVKQGIEKARVDAQVADALTHLVGVD